MLFRLNARKCRVLRLTLQAETMFRTMYKQSRPKMYQQRSQQACHRTSGISSTPFQPLLMAKSDTSLAATPLCNEGNSKVQRLTSLRSACCTFPLLLCADNLFFYCFHLVLVWLVLCSTSTSRLLRSLPPKLECMSP